MKSLVRVACCAGVVLTVTAACSPPSTPIDDGTFKAATAEALPGIDLNAVKISNAQRQALKWTWEAQAGSNTYSCDADERMRLPSCTPTA